MEKHGPAVWHTAHRLLGNHTDAADCFQETFVCALQISRRQGVRNFSPLLVRLATQRAIDLLRRRTRRSGRHVNLTEWVAARTQDADPAQQLEQRELAARLRAAISQLPRTEAQAFCLRYLSDMSYEQIAQELDMTANAVGVLLHRAKAYPSWSLQQYPPQ